MLFDAPDARMIESRNRMISFRVTSEEYARFRDRCLARGIRNVSEFVRLAVNQLLADDTAQAANEKLTSRVGSIEARLAALESQLTSAKSAGGD